MLLTRVVCRLILITLVLSGATGTAWCAGAPDTVALTAVPLAGIGALSRPTSVATDAAGNMYFANTGSHQVVMLKVDDTTVVIGDGSAGFAGDGLADPATARLNAPQGVAVDAGGNLYIADTGNHRIRKVLATAGSISGASTVTTVAGNGAAGFSGDTFSATAASLKEPAGVAVDAAGNVYIADSGNYRIRKLTLSTGKIATIAGDGTPGKMTVAGIALAPTGDLYIADPGHSVVLKMTKATGTAAPFAGTGALGYAGDGGLAKDAILKQPSGVATDGDNLYIADTGNNAVRKVSLATEVISTRAGAGATAAISHAFSSPVGVAIDPAGMVYVADMLDDAVKEIYPAVSAQTTASVAGGIYVTPQSVTLTPNKAVSQILYTVDGGNPLIFGLVYSTPISISATTTLRFASLDLSGNAETVSTVAYLFVAAPISNATIDHVPVGGVYTTSRSSLLVTLASTGSAIYYTTDGKTPTTSSTRYTAPISIPVGEAKATTTLKFFSTNAYGHSEAVKSVGYTTVALPVPKTTVSLKSGTFASIQTVSLAVDDSTASIYYTTDGSAPTTLSPKYSLPLVIDKTTTLQYFASNPSGSRESVKSEVYTIITLKTTAYPAGGVFTTDQSVTLVTNSPGATIYYTTDGSTPAPAGETTKKYSVPIPVTGTDRILARVALAIPPQMTVLQYFAVDKAGVVEALKAELYTVDNQAPGSSAECQSSDPDTGAPTNIIILTAEDDADRRPNLKYIANTATDNGSPVAAYTPAEYNSGITFSGNTIVKFFAADAAGNTESVNTAYCPDVISFDPKPSVYLETLADGFATSGSKLHVRGHVAPFGETTLTVNGTAVSTSSFDGAFSQTLDLPLAGDLLSVSATVGGEIETEVRTVTKDLLAVPATLSIGTSNAVAGNRLRIPITVSSGYQAAAATLDVRYDHAKLALPEAELSPLAKAFGKTLLSNTLPGGDFRMVITDALGNSMGSLPDGVLAYLSFEVSATVDTTDALTNEAVAGNLATDLGAAAMANVAAPGGTAVIVQNPGDIDANGATTLDELMKAVNMLMQPALYPADGAVDLDADGVVSVWEMQRLINAFVGL